jgi:hypothetical protein
MILSSMGSGPDAYRGGYRVVRDRQTGSLSGIADGFRGGEQKIIVESGS